MPSPSAAPPPPDDRTRRVEKIDLTQETARIRTLDRGSLHRKLGVRDIFGIAYGDIGSSIIYALGIVTAFAFGAMPLAIAIAGVFFIFTALTYAELGATIPESGGSGTFARRAFNSDLLSFIAGWALLLDYVLTAAISAYTIGSYLGHFNVFPLSNLNPSHPGYTMWIIALAALLISFLCYLNIRGIKDSSWLSLVLTSICLLTFAVLIAWGLYTVFDVKTFIQGHAALGTKPTWESFMNAIALSMVAYIGIETATQLAGEAKDPGKTVPRAIKLVVVVLLVVYIGTVAVAMCIPPAPTTPQTTWPEQLGTTWKEQPLIGVAQGLPKIGPAMATWMSLLAAVLLFVAVNSGLIGSSRLAYSMADHLQLPRPFQALHPTRKTPWFSLIFFGAAAVAVLLITQNMERLGDLYNFGSMLAFSMAHASLIGMRIREPNLARPYKLRGNLKIRGREIPVTALLGLLATGATWVYVVWERPLARMVGFGWLGVGLMLYFFFRRREDVSFTEAVKIEKVSVPEFQTWKVNHVLVPTLGGPSTDVVQVACKIAAAHGAKVTALYIIEVPEAIALETFLGAQWRTGEKALDRAEAISREYGVELHRKLIQSRQAGPTITEISKEEKCDLIVLGTAPRSPGTAAGPVFGRTVEFVARKAPCRVFICSSTYTI